MNDHRIVSQDEWLTAGAQLLAQEKAFTRQRDQLSDLRQSLPWVRVDKEYVFDGPKGRDAPAAFQWQQPVADLSLHVRDRLE